MKTLSYKLLLGLTVLFTLGAVLTLIPYAGASYPNVFGYYSLCTYAPAATLYCLLAAGIVCFIRSTFIKDQEENRKERFKRHSNSLTAMVLVLILAVSSSIWFVSIKTQYTDDMATATVLEE